MSYISEKTNSSYKTNEADKDLNFNSLIIKSNKMTNTIRRKSFDINSLKSSTISSQIKKEKYISDYQNRFYKYEENKNSILPSLNKYKFNMLFNNSLIREKQKFFKRNSVVINDCKMNIKEEPQNFGFIVNNNTSLLKIFLSQTRSNFNNKYKIIYSISSWKQKDQIKTLLDSIKKNEHKTNFQDYLKLKLAKRSSSCKIGLRKRSINNKINFDISPKIESLTNDYLKDILHKNNLIKISTLKSIKDSKINKNNKKRTKLKKSNTEIFYNNNTFFKTMPIKIIKSKKNSSLL